MDDGIYQSPFNNDSQQIVFNPLTDKGPIRPSDPISLDVPDDDLVEVIKTRVEASKKFYENKYNLKERRYKNETYLFGRQIQSAEKKNELKTYEARVNDNVLYEIEASLKPLALAHLPDMIVTPGTPDDPQKEQSAKDLSIVVNDMNKSREQRNVLGLGFRHLPVYFTAIIKVRWNPELGEHGDIEFLNVHPDYIVADHTAKTNRAEDMEFVNEVLPVTVQDLFMRFPDKKPDIIIQLGKMGITIGDDPTWKELASEVEIWETHFTWYRKKGTSEGTTDPMALLNEPGVKWERIEGIVWKLEDTLLKKMLTPNFDWEGEDQLGVPDPNNPESMQQLQPQEILNMVLTGQPMDHIQKQTIYHNYFGNAKKPYFFFGYEQWGKIPYDETSRIEQNIRNQENLDTQVKQIVDTLKARVKHIWSKDSGLKAEDVQTLDLDNPKLDALVEGNVNEVHGQVNPERPDAAQFNNVQSTRDRMFSMAGANAIRGDLQTDVATSNQIAREADFTRADDLVEDTINAASEWMAEWRMQLMKLRYTEEHMIQVLGTEGKTSYVRLRRDDISDGMEVRIKSSSTDKLTAQKNAMQMAQLKLTDPKSFYEDMGMTDPTGRTEKLMLFTTDPAGYLVKYVLGLQDANAQAAALGAQPTPPSSMPGQPTPPPLVPQPTQPTPTDTSQIPTQPQASPRVL